MATESVVKTVEKRLKRHPGRVFTYDDFDDLPVTAVGPALSRLTARGEIRRVRKGVYFVPRRSVLGDVPPDPSLVGSAVARGRSHPAGLSAANLLGLTTQVPARLEIAVEDKRPTPPRGIAFRPRIGTERRSLLAPEAALLEVLRDIRHLTDLAAEATIERLGAVIEDETARSKVIRAALHEPPRVRAMVGALAEHVGARPEETKRLRKSLNPTSRFDFGPLGVLPTARSWSAR